MSSSSSRSGSVRHQQRVQQQRAQRALEQRRRRRRLAALGVGAVVVIAAVVGILVGTHQSTSTSSQGTAVPPGVTAAGGIVVGSSTARQKVVLYEDPQCPVCGRFEKTTGRVLAEGVKRGTVAVEYRMRSFLGPESVRAVNALGAAQAGGRFEAFREQMYAEQPAERTGGYTSDDLIALGARVGLTGKDFTDAVKEMKYGGWVHQVDDQASKDGNVATPEMRLNGKVVPQGVLFDEAALAKLLQVSA